MQHCLVRSYCCGFALRKSRVTDASAGRTAHDTKALQLLTLKMGKLYSRAAGTTGQKMPVLSFNCSVTSV